MAKKALLTGINDYQTISDLRGCINDVRNIEKRLVDVFGFSTGDIRVLTNREVTKENIEREWSWLVDDAQPGDQLLFHFSGHGSYTVDEDGDEDDGADELLCLYDMDFDDDRTYLLDDDLYRLTRRLPDGADLTVILDSCHSGTATRMLFSPESSRSTVGPAKMPLVDLSVTARRLEQSAGQGRAGARATDTLAAMDRIQSSRSIREQRDVVLARFIEPPTHVFERLHRRGTRSGFGKPATDHDRTMNHVLLSGSSPTQTSADAYINSDYNGAFSYYLCEELDRAGGRHELGDLIGRIRAVLKQEGFSQVPQLEPEGVRGEFLGSRRDSEASGKTTDESGTQAVLQDIRDELRQIRDTLSARPIRGDAGRATTGHRALVYVHGITEHTSGYSDDWWNSLSGHLPRAVRDTLARNRKEVLWSRHVNSRDVRTGSRFEQEQADFEVVALRDILEERAAQHAVAVLPDQENDARPERSPSDRSAQDRGIFDIGGIDDFVKYMFNDSIRDAVQREFINVVHPLLRDGLDVDIISHSWGTVVAYESLHRMRRDEFDGRVRNLFTVGSALSIGRVQRQLEQRGGQKPRHVDRWVNLDAKGDVVGGQLRGTFQVDEEFLNLFPTGCRVFRFLPVNPVCAHGSYFKNDNRAVNGGIFARRIAATT